MLLLPVPTTKHSTYQTELDSVVFTLTFRYMEPVGGSPYFTLDLATGAEVPLYSGAKLVSGVRLCNTSGNPAQPAGVLGVAVLGSATSPPSLADFQSGRAVLFYEPAV